MLAQKRKPTILDDQWWGGGADRAIGLTGLRAGGGWWTAAPGSTWSPLWRQESCWLGTVLKIHSVLSKVLPNIFTTILLTYTQGSSKTTFVPTKCIFCLDGHGDCLLFTHSPWRIRLFSFLWSSLWHSSPKREAAFTPTHIQHKDTVWYSATVEALTMDWMPSYLTVVNSIN